MVDKKVLVETDECQFTVDADTNFYIKCGDDKEIGLGTFDIMFLKKIIEIMEED